MNNISEIKSLLKQPSAWIPLVMSFVALVFLLSYVAMFGLASGSPDGDEGTPARIFQLIMAAQLPFIAYFALVHLPKRAMQTMIVLALQAIAWVIPIITVIWFESL